MNALNCVWLDTYIVQIIIQQELEKLTKVMQDSLILKTKNFHSKLQILTKLKKRIALSLVFLFMKTSKNTQPMCQKIHFDSLLIEEGKMHYVLIKDFNTFIYDHTLHRGRKHFCHYCL